MRLLFRAELRRPGCAWSMFDECSIDGIPSWPDIYYPGTLCSQLLRLACSQHRLESGVTLTARPISRLLTICVHCVCIGTKGQQGIGHLRMSPRCPVQGCLPVCISDMHGGTRSQQQFCAGQVPGKGRPVQRSHTPGVCSLRVCARHQQHVGRL